MKTSTKVLLGFATLWPVLYVFVFISAIVLVVLFAGHDAGRSDPGGDSLWLPLGFVGLIAVHMFTILEMLALKVFYVIRVFKTEQLDQNMRIMWTLLLVFATIVAEPVFWYLYIWREQPAALQNQPQLLAPGVQTAWRRQTKTPPSEAAYVPPSQPPDWR
jgi:hypothetical protein